VAPYSPIRSLSLTTPSQARPYLLRRFVIKLRHGAAQAGYCVLIPIGESPRSNVRYTGAGCQRVHFGSPDARQVPMKRP
jgi:hypothetical protein